MKVLNVMNMIMKRSIFLGMTFLFMLNLMIVPTLFAQNKSIIRMGATDTQSFDENWLFSRYGLQSDGSRKEKTKNLESENYNDTSWQKLDLPHDWAITGPFRIDLTGETGKLPWKGIGWYRKHFTIPATDAGKQIFVDFDGAMAYA